MMGRAGAVVASVLLTGGFATLHAQERPFTIAFKGNVTTGSQLFPNPNSADPLERAQFFPLTGIFGYSVEARYQIPETDIAIGLSADYVRTTEPQSIRLSSTRSVPVEDGYRVIPVEVTAYFILPISGPTFGIFMGGGGGAYFGRRIYKIGGVEAVPIDQGHGFGIHVLGGLSYRISELVSIIGEMKFRDLQFEASNAFSTPTVTFENTVINVSQEPFTSRIHTDGIVFQLGAAISF
ncbi:MAG: hypothetical protein HY708_07550 [Ignavibacteriae bacterium]|nr:hypothetical protein [Ignavibacteriota bacterium]